MFSLIYGVLAFIYSIGSCDDFALAAVRSKPFASQTAVKNALFNPADNRVTVSWETASPATSEYYVGKKTALYFLSDEGVGVAIAPNGMPSAHGGTYFWITDRDGVDFSGAQVSGTESGILLPEGGKWRIYSASYGCNPELEKSKVKWKLWADPDGKPNYLLTGDDKPKLKIIPYEGVNGTLEFLTILELPANEYPLAVTLNSGSWSYSRSSFTRETSFSEFCAKVSAGTSTESYYSEAGATYVAIKQSASNIASNHQITGKVTLSSGKVKDVATTVLPIHWSAALFSALYKQLLIGKSSPAIFAGGILALAIEGSWLDQGEAFLKAAGDEFKLKQSVDLNDIIAINRQVNSNPASFGSRLGFSNVDVGMSGYAGGYSRLDLKLDLPKKPSDLGPPGELPPPVAATTLFNLAERYYISWGPGIQPFRLNSSTKQIEGLVDCSEKSCRESSYPIGNTVEIRSELSEEEIADIANSGLWIRATEGEEYISDFIFDSTNVARTTWSLRVLKGAPGFEPMEIAKYSGYIDPRPVVGMPTVRFSYKQKSGGLPDLDYSVQDWKPARSPILVMDNPQQLRIAKTGIGSKTPPVFSTSEFREEFSEENKTGIEVESLAEPWEIHVLPTEEDGEEEIAEGNNYATMIAAKTDDGIDATSSRLLVPFDYWVSKHVNAIVISGEKGSKEHQKLLEQGSSLARTLMEKNHLYTEIYDLSKWNLGGVYFQTKGITQLVPSYGELAVLLNGVPKNTSANASAVRTPIQSGAIIALGSSDPDKLPLVERAKLSNSTAGKLFEDIDWTNQDELNALGIQGVVDPDLLKGYRAKWFGMFSPENLCFTTQTGSLMCYDLKFWQDNKETIQGASKEFGLFLGQWAGTELLGPYGWGLDLSMAAYDFKKGDRLAAGFGVVGAFPVIPNASRLVKAGEKEVKATARYIEELEKAAKLGLKYADELDPVRRAERIILERPANSVWRMNPFARGKEIEKMPLMGLGARPPNIAGNFPTIDDYDEVLKIATSVKSMDATKYLNPKRFEARIRRYRKLVEDFVPPKSRWAEVDPITEIAERKLLMVFEEGSLTLEQLSILEKITAENSSQLKMVFEFK